MRRRSKLMRRPGTCSCDRIFKSVQSSSTSCSSRRHASSDFAFAQTPFTPGISPKKELSLRSLYFASSIFFAIKKENIVPLLYQYLDFSAKQEYFLQSFA